MNHQLNRSPSSSPSSPSDSPMCAPSDDELLDLQEEYGDRYNCPGYPEDSPPQYSPKALTFRRPGHYAYRSSHSKAQIFAVDRFGILPREMVLGLFSLHFRCVLLPQDRRRPDLHQLFSQGLRFPTFSGSFLTPSGSSWSQNQRGLAVTGISPTIKLWLCFTTTRLAR